MDYTFLLLLVAIAFLVFIFREKLFASKVQELFPYSKKEYFLNIPERKLYSEIKSILPTDFVIVPQVLMSNIVQVTTKKKDFWTYQNKINRKTVDFVIFDSIYLKPILVIEYDGKSHARKDRVSRDTFVETVLQNVEIEFVRIAHHKNINYKDIAGQIVDFLNSAEPQQVS